jgi:hypothetical protein
MAPAAAPQQGAQAPAQQAPAMPMQNTFSILAAAPITLTNLFTRQANEAINTIGLGTTQLATSLSLPALPFAVPQLPSLPAPNALALPNFPGLGMLPGSSSAPATAQLYSSAPQQLPVRRIGPRVVV